ncbi:hypothetical protein SY89_01902 [Halolamina pelagica]|uniref:Uncharacterized protein n=2 Tax=Halolamina pelagica TaxID=699431 RepID=A0A0P7GBM7_9EURY|nr:hypothetical protein SY89_01902 [Halolamina pelagica]
MATMPAHRSALGSVSAAASRIVDVATTVAVAVGLVGWTLFWSNLARLHYAHGELPSALFTAGAFVAPALAALVWYVGEGVGADMPTPSFGPSITSS